MLAFLKLFLKLYLADTPHRRNASILEVGSEQLQVNIVLMNRDKSTETFGWIQCFLPFSAYFKYRHMVVRLMPSLCAALV